MLLALVMEAKCARHERTPAGSEVVEQEIADPCDCNNQDDHPETIQGPLVDIELA